ncbi:hypothetical protein [Halioxenophilus aromaticivorans]|uniref:Lipoprotein n=1 Tax=Halioxenophilus aromaticivorans TaxID=1306992 RepID=A0AAV3U8F2_9ALTE
MQLRQITEQFKRAGLFGMVLAGLSGCSEKMRGTPPDTYPDGGFEPVSIYSILANPSQFSQRHIEVKGYLAFHDGYWSLLPSKERTAIIDLPSTIRLRVAMLDEERCNGAWVAVKGVTKPFIGIDVEFDPDKIQYISLAEHPGRCYVSEEFAKKIKSGKGKVIIVEDGEEIPPAEPRDEESPNAAFQ